MIYGTRPSDPRPVTWCCAREQPEETDVNPPEALQEVMSADLPAGAFLLDVREDDEWAAGHAPGAVHVRLRDLAARFGELPDGVTLWRARRPASSRA
jgi:3-mercaptopyruvate sulfurtransferase SseA